MVNNQQVLIIKVELSEDYLRGRVVSNTTSPRFHTPTTSAFAPDTLLVSNAEFFDQSEAGPPFFRTRIPQP